MINSTENLSLDQDFIRCGRLLQRSLHEALSSVVLSIGVPDSTQVRATSINTAQWNIKKTSATPVTLPESLELYLPQALTPRQEPMNTWE